MRGMGIDRLSEASRGMEVLKEDSAPPAIFKEVPENLYSGQGRKEWVKHNNVDIPFLGAGGVETELG